nr:MAG TPA: hypothetical protein [Caudoviricetes sp.]
MGASKEESLSWASGVPAPRDADGQVVPLDVTELYTDAGKLVTVEEITFDGAWWYVKCLETTRLRLIRFHLEQDSWERLEKDASKNSCGYFGRSGLCVDCPALAISKMCNVAKSEDIVRRAKALAGVSVND